MIKRTFTYKDYDGKQQTDVCYFNMNKAEIATMQVRMDGKYIDHLKDLLAKEKIEELFHFFKDLVLDSYGEKSSDGKRFIKSAQMREEFEQSIVFSDLIVDLISSPEKMADFTKGILPPDFAEIVGNNNATPAIQAT